MRLQPLRRWTGGAVLFLVAVSGCAPRRELAGAARPAPSEIVYYGETSRIRGFDPVKTGDIASTLAMGKVYEGLLQYGYFARPYRAEPNLAEALPEVSADGLTYRFRVRSGIYFQDDPCFAATGGKGRELTADDFVYAIKRLADFKNASTGYWILRDRVVGLDEFRSASGGPGATDYSQDVPGLRAPDRRTLEIRLKRPYPQLLWVLTMHYTFAVPREAVEFYGSDFLNHPVGTGPFVLRAWRQNYRMEFVRSPQWRATGRVEQFPAAGTNAAGAADVLPSAAGEPLPRVDRIVQYVIGDPSTQWLLFLSGALESSGVSKDNWDAVFAADGTLTADIRARGIQLHSAPALDIAYLGFNMDDPVVGRNRALRQAMASAFDGARWVRFQKGRVVPATGPIPPGISGCAPEPARYPFDLARAAELLQTAGYPQGRDPATGRRLALTLELGAADPETRETAEVIADFMGRIGIVVESSFNNRPTFFRKIEQRRAQMFILNWAADYPDAENFLQLFYAPNSSPGANRTNYANPEFDRLYEQLRSMPESAERAELCRRMVALVQEDCPWIFLHHPVVFELQHPWVQNVVPHDFPYGMFKYYAIDAQAREAWRASRRR